MIEGKIQVDGIVKSEITNFPKTKEFEHFSRIKAFTATTTAQKILDAKINRKAVLIYNNSTETAYLISNAQGTATQGIPIKENVCYSSENYSAQCEYWIIVAANTADLRIEEILVKEL